MPQGIQIWDASGNLILDISDRVYKTLAVATVTEGTPATVTIADIGATGTRIVVDNTDSEDSDSPIITAIGSTSVDIGWIGGNGGTSTKTITILEY